jgi:hypothetical protein
MRFEESFRLPFRTIKHKLLVKIRVLFQEIERSQHQFGSKAINAEMQKLLLI